MNDTSPEMHKKMHELIRQKTPEERAKMGWSMYLTSRYIITQVILQKKPDITPAELRKELFLAFYKNDFSPAEREKILHYLETGTQ